MIIRMVTAAVLLALCLAGACASDDGAAGRGPGMIAIRNTSGRQAQSISLQEDKQPAEASRRMGAMSPVMPNRTYAFVRPANAPSLPAKVRVNYAFPGGAPQSTVVDLREATRHATGASNEAVVFDLRADGSVAVYLDQVQP